VGVSKIVSYKCSQYTPQKNQDFRFILGTHIKITDCTLRKHRWANQNYNYFDITAGPGSGKYGFGSPLIFVGEIGLIERQYRAVFIDQDETAYQRLQICLAPYSQNGNLSIHCGEHHEVLKKYLGIWRTKDFGLLFDDPSGQIPSFDLLAVFAKYYPRIDILIYITPTNIKRQYHCKLCSCDLRLDDYIKRIPKKYWIIREPKGCHQWTFLLGTNWDSFPSFKNKGFYRIDSLEGQVIFDRANLTKEELNGTNGNLFN